MLNDLYGNQPKQESPKEAAHRIMVDKLLAPQKAKWQPDPTPTQQAFLDELGATKVLGLYQVSYNAATATLYRKKNMIKISKIETTIANREHDHATQLLQKICQLADKHSITLALSVEADGSGGPDNLELTKWYQKQGFESDDREMIRKPNQARPVG